MRCAVYCLAVVLVLAVAASSPASAGETVRVETVVGRVAAPAVVYYGYLNTSLLPATPPALLVFAGTPAQLSSPVLGSLRGSGTVLIAYPHDDGVPVGVGSSFREHVVEGGWSVDEWVSYVNALIDRYAGLVDGVLLDQADPAYFTGNLSPSNPLIANFTRALERIVEHAHSRGLIVVVNGVRAYAGLGDLYVWEGWCSTWEPGAYGPVYSYVSDFFQPHTGDSNPYVWVNDYAKLVYLEERGLLGRTIAISYTPPDDPGRATVCHASATLAGFAYWAYADPYHFATGGPVPPMPYYSLGVVWRASFNPSNSTITGLTLAGPVRISVGPTWSIEAGPGFLKRSWEAVPSSRGDAGPGLDIVDMEVMSDGYTFTVRLRLDQNFTGNAVHLYLDTDSNTSTGYRVLGMIGADMMIEAYPSGYAMLYNYTGDGSTWSWEPVHQVYASFHGDTVMLSPVAPIGGAEMLAATIDSNWSIADYEPSTPLPVPAVSGPAPLYASWSMASSGAPGTAIARRLPWGVEIVANNPSGTYSLLSIAMPVRPLSVTQQSPGSPPVPLPEASSPGELLSMERGYLAEPAGGYYNVTIKAGPHGSPIVILAGTPSTVGGVLVPAHRGPPLAVWKVVLPGLAAVLVVWLAGRRAR